MADYDDSDFDDSDFDDSDFDDMDASDSADAEELDLTPRTRADDLDLTPQNRDAIKRGSKTGPIIILVALVAGVAALLFQGLSGASLFIREADTAVADRDELQDRRFQLVGSPIAVSDEEFNLEGGAAVRFSIACDGTAVDIIHRGNVAESFQLGVPVVLEGNWETSEAIGEPWLQGANDGFYFESDQMLVRHDNEYREDRIEEAASCGEDLPDSPDAVANATGEND